MRGTTFLALALALVGGCGTPAPETAPEAGLAAPAPTSEPTPTPVVDPRVVAAAGVATAIAGGQSAEAALAAAGLTPEALEALLFAIAEDPALSAAYAAAIAR